jgi:hypothetical protein
VIARLLRLTLALLLGVVLGLGLRALNADDRSGRYRCDYHETETWGSEANPPVCDRCKDEFLRKAVGTMTPIEEGQ